jgi:integrase
MPRQPGKVPAYCRHRASGRAVVRIDGQDHYLGDYGSAESHEHYERLIAEWRVQRQEQSRLAERKSNALPSRAKLTVEQVLGLYWKFAKGYYVREGKATKELTSMKYAIRPVRRLYGRSRAQEFGPLALKAVRQHLIDKDLCRTEINRRIHRIKRVFKWAVSEELVPPSVYEGLHAVTSLTFGRTSARETAPIKPVNDAWVEATLPFVSPEVGALIQLQRLTGMRPGEVVQLRMCDIDTSGEVWVFEPASHKNRWREHQRLVPLGPKAQRLIGKFVKLSMAEYIFSPVAAEERRNHLRRQARATPMTPSQAKRRRHAHPRRAKRDCYDVDSYRRAITYGIKKAARLGVDIPHWHPNQLRHSRGTEVRRRHGIEAAQVSLGHARADVTQVYAERNMELAMTVAKQSG